MTAAHYRFQALALERLILQKAWQQRSKRYTLRVLLTAGTQVKEELPVFNEDIARLVLNILFIATGPFLRTAKMNHYQRLGCHL